MIKRETQREMRADQKAIAKSHRDACILEVVTMNERGKPPRLTHTNLLEIVFQVEVCVS
jgi:hypothetical protein